MEYISLILSIIFTILLLASIIYILTEQLHIKRQFFDISASIVVYILLMAIVDLLLLHFFKIPIWLFILILFVFCITLFKWSLRLKWKKAYSVTWRFLISSLFPIYILFELLVTPFYINLNHEDCNLKKQKYVLINRIHYGLTLPFYDEQLIIFNQVKRNDLAFLKNIDEKSQDFLSELEYHFTFRHYFNSIDKRYLIQRVVAVGGDRISIKNDQLFINDKIKIYPGCNKDTDINFDFMKGLPFIYLPIQGDHIQLKFEKNLNLIELIFNSNIKLEISYKAFFKSSLFSVYRNLFPDDIKSYYKNENNWNRIVNKDYVLLLNDDRSQLNDSRGHGIISIDMLLGKVMILFSPDSKVKSR